MPESKKGYMKCQNQNKYSLVSVCWFGTRQELKDIFLVN